MKKIYLLVLCILLNACARVNVQQYQALRPKLDLPHYFIGTTDAWGMFQKRSGEVVKRFHVVITGSQNHDALILDERFTYDDGTTQQRIWTLAQQPDGRWSGKADDVKGEAIGTIAGNTLHWNYTLRLPVDDHTYEVQFDDWMFLIDEQTMLNRASMSKFGIEIGQVTLFFKKRI
ncbi:DUF3833 domain-containing protein [Collimonas pratensis]|uniref:DUF3833 domain-containing protein n=1 Tax=Collimonas TaxID=202907 RepID=UPI0007828822|nr:DUF3833 domain-containing protein [Collimonas pratensis]